jgi:hypothetical protein
LQVIDVQDPAQPGWIYQGNDSTYTQDFEVLGGYAYLLTQKSDTFYKSDLNNPISPTTTLACIRGIQR